MYNYEYYSNGLSFRLLSDGTYCVSKGTCTDENVIVPRTYNGKYVSQIDCDGFYEYYKMKSIKLPDTIKIIGSYAFGRCINLSSINIPYGVNTIETYAFSHSGVSNVNIPKSVNTIMDHTFEFCSNLKSIYLPNSITRLGRTIFFGCENLTVCCEERKPLVGYPRGYDKSCFSGVENIKWGW